jgi:uncharacterized protein YjiK
MKIPSLALTVILCVFVLAFNFQSIAASTESSTLYGVIGNHLVTVNKTTWNATDVGIINATGLMGLTFDPDRCNLYSVANGTTDPQLIVIDRETAQATLVGPIDLEGQDPEFLKFVESLAFNPNDGILYASAASAPSISNMLVRIDPSTAKATPIASITGTTQNDGDSLVFVNGTLYLADSNPGSALFMVNLSTGVATSVGGIGFNDIKLAYDSENQMAYGVDTLNRLLITISLSTGQGTELGPTHTPEQFEGAFMTAITVATEQSIPEFFSALILSLLMLVALIAILFCRKNDIGI